ncbi:nuclear transport factor 2 family protein [Microbacterium sp. I2]|uniref:nuclear transport factor 2 family protein n=1 Tax=Microbacterium sp. I2 TaxID=3391826 RepID=UPI003ED99BB2
MTEAAEIRTVEPDAVLDTMVSELARDVDRAESLRAVKDLERRYAHARQMGNWSAMAALFTAGAVWDHGDGEVRGRTAIRSALSGGQPDGLSPGAVATELIDQPLINLSTDGERACGRWLSLSFLGDGDGTTGIRGGIYENTYLREQGVWRISEHRYHPQFDGDHAHGWTNVGQRDLPVVPFHFEVDETGAPVPPHAQPAPPADAPLSALEDRITSLNEEDAVRNLQHAYGYYVDRRMWPDIVDMFTDDCVIRVGEDQTYRGHDGLRRFLETMGPEGLGYGQLNDRPLFDTVVRVDARRGLAVSRGIEFGMLGDVSRRSAAWEISVFRNRFVQRGGRWRFAELWMHPVLRADYFEGWGSGDGIVASETAPALLAERDAHTLDSSSSSAADVRAESADAEMRVADAQRRLRRASAYDAVENVSAAYGFYLDDFQWPQLAALFASRGNKQSPFAGYYLGRDRIAGSVTANWGAPPATRPGISYHWRTQPVIHVAADGRSAHLRTRLFQPRTSKEPSRPGEFYAAGFHGGMYPNDQLVLEDGVWRLWSLTIDEPYFTSIDWKGGWAGVPAPRPGSSPRPSPLLEKYPPDIPMTALGRREEHFRGGTGELIEWPGILPMWFHYRNPVSGRTPERYWPDCVPSEYLPATRMTAHGYQMPPNGPERDGVELPPDYIEPLV